MEYKIHSFLTADDKIGVLLKRYSKERTRLFVILFISYVGFYFCRVNLVAALPALEHSFGLTKTQSGSILSSYFILYTIGKLVNGLLANKIQGKSLLLLGIGGSVICNILFGFGRGLTFFVVVWSANAFYQSMGWLAMVSILSHWYSSKESGRTMGIISLSYLLGDFLARSSAGLLLGRANASWTELFWIHAAIFAAIGIIACLTVKTSPEEAALCDVDVYSSYHDSGMNGAKENLPTKTITFSQSENIRWLSIMLRNRSFWIACLIYIGLSVIRYVFWNWSIVYLKDIGFGISTSVITSAIFPVGGSLGAILAGLISDKMRARRGPVLAFMTSFMGLFIYLFIRVPGDNHLLLLITLGILGIALIGPYSLLAGAMAIDFGSKYSAATAAGIIDATGAIGAVLSGAGMGYLIDRLGWDGAFLIIIAIAVFTALLCFTLWKLRPLRDVENQKS